MRRFFGIPEPEERTSTRNGHARGADSSKPDHVLVKHGKQFLRVDFGKPGDIAKGYATVGDVRATTARLLGHSKDDIVIVFGGKKLLDDKLPLRKANVVSGSRMLCIVSHPHAQAAPRPQVAKPPKPTDPLERINLVLSDAEKELLPSINEFTSSPPESEANRADRHRVLSELILQRLFSLDEIDTHDNPEARKRRKDAVNKFHEYQAQVDSVVPAPE